MGVDFVFEVILNVPRHDDKRLANQKQKETFEQCHDQNQKAIKQNTKRKNVIHFSLHRRAVEQEVNIERFADQIERIAHQLSRNDTEKIGQNGKNSTQNQVPFVFDKIFIEVCECFHVVIVCLLNRDGMTKQVMPSLN
jgi:hypothetical protein